MEGRILTVLTDIVEVVVGESWAIAWCWRTGTVLPVLPVLPNRDSSGRHVLGNRGESWLGRKSCSCFAKKHFDANYCGEPWWGEVGTSCKVMYCHPEQHVWDTKTVTPSSLGTNSISLSSPPNICVLLTVFFHPCVQSGLSTLAVGSSSSVSNANIFSCLFSDYFPLPPFPTTADTFDTLEMVKVWAGDWNWHENTKRGRKPCLRAITKHVHFI